MRMPGDGKIKVILTSCCRIRCDMIVWLGVPLTCCSSWGEMSRDFQQKQECDTYFLSVIGQWIYVQPPPGKGKQVVSHSLFVMRSMKLPGGKASETHNLWVMKCDNSSARYAMSLTFCCSCDQCGLPRKISPTPLTSCSL